MRMVARVLAAALLVLAGAPASAQRANVRERTNSSVVTILTDAVADPGSRGAALVHELAQRVAATGKIRVLPVSGQGAAANVRDLLYLRGVDFALLNSDILASLDLIGEHPDARRRIRYVSHLLDQRIYLLVRLGIGGLDALRGRKLAVLSSSGASMVTAQTLTGLLRLDVGLRGLGPGSALDDAALEGLDGALLLTDDLARVRLSPETLRQLHLLEIPLSQPLQSAYLKGSIGADELVGRAGPATVETVAVATLLAVFDWTPGQRRYSDVADFMAGFFGVLPEMRREGTPAVWGGLDINASIPGWIRHPAAQPAKVLSPAELAALSMPEGTPSQPRPTKLAAVAQPTPGPPATASGPAPGPQALIVHASERPPFSGRSLKDGGLISAILARSLAGNDQGRHAGARLDLRWSRGAGAAIDSALADRTFDIAIPWDGVDCDRPGDLIQVSAGLCDGAIYSDPLLQAIIGYFTLADSPAIAAAPSSTAGSSICLPQDRDLADLGTVRRKALADKQLQLVRAPSLLDCIGRVQRREADGFVANELEGRHLLGRLGLAPLFRLADEPLATRGVHAVVSRRQPGAEEIVNAINQGLAKLKQGDGYNMLVREHLIETWEQLAPAR